jgi:hypothetical protein
VLVCGGRDYSDRDRVFAELDALAAYRRLGVVIHGAETGVDSLAGAWAQARGVHCRAYPANWDTDGKAAGLLRNQQMLDVENPDLVVAFSGGRGTNDMVTRARAAGIEILEIV